MLHLAAKAFWPAPVPFTLLHVDTGHNFPEVLEYRDRTVARLGAASRGRPRAGLHRRRPPAASAPTAPATRCRPLPLLDAIARPPLRRRLRRRPPRRGEGPRQGADLLACATSSGQWDPRNQRPELWNLYNGRHAPGRARAGLPAVELDRAGRLALHRARADRAARRSTTPTSARCSSATACGWPSATGAGRASDETVEDRHGALPHRRRHVAAPAPSSPTPPTVDDVIAEVAATRLTERGATRADDRISEAAMEDRKKEGYF